MGTILKPFIPLIYILRPTDIKPDYYFTLLILFVNVLHFSHRIKLMTIITEYCDDFMLL